MSAAKRWACKEAAEIARAVVAAGGQAERTKRGHMKVTGPAGVAFVPTKLGGGGGGTLHAVLSTIATKAGLVLTLKRRPG